MGAAQSTRIESTVQDVACPCASNDACGQENLETYKAKPIENDESSSDDDDSCDEEEWFEERLQILQDTRQLRRLAEFFLCPEKPVNVDPTTLARCYFSRYSAADQADLEDYDERENILADMKAMKKVAVDYLHPELPVMTTDPYACGRNYFDRPSAFVADSWEDADEREQILADMKAMKKLAVDYLHPELPVMTTDPCGCGRNYFNRPSAVLADSCEDADEREQILADMKAMKKLAVDYLHPELPVMITDPCACGRNYFTRASADSCYSTPDTESVRDEDERYEILEDVRWMKTLADGIMHPEVSVDYSGFESDHGGHFDMDEDVPLSWTPYYPASMTSDNIKPATCGHDKEANMAFSPPCVMLMH